MVQTPVPLITIKTYNTKKEELVSRSFDLSNVFMEKDLQLF
jgi:hypothetical protein